MLHVVLYEPEIPPNTGNVMRLCANTGAALHLVEPLGFSLNQRALRRAGLDYREWARVHTHTGLKACLEAIRPGRSPRVFAFSTRGLEPYDSPRYALGDVLLFGPETRGLPDEVLDGLVPERRMRIPMQANSRSLNLSNAVAVAVYEAWRQLGFPGSELPEGAV
ncbi:MAG: tRNA (cytidine(34)-2'-O)-methyltransferase [Pseudomonadota bacterium]